MKENLVLRAKAKTLEPVVRIGKSGLTENIVKEINKNLSKRKLIKIKLLRSSYEDKGKFIESIVQATKSELIESIGNVIVLYREL